MRVSSGSLALLATIGYVAAVPISPALDSPNSLRANQFSSIVVPWDQPRVYGSHTPILREQSALRHVKREVLTPEQQKQLEITARIMFGELTDADNKAINDLPEDQRESKTDELLDQKLETAMAQFADGEKNAIMAELPDETEKHLFLDEYPQLKASSDEVSASEKLSPGARELRDVVRKWKADDGYVIQHDSEHVSEKRGVNEGGRKVLEKRKRKSGGGFFKVFKEFFQKVRQAFTRGKPKGPKPPKPPKSSKPRRTRKKSPASGAPNGSPNSGSPGTGSPSKGKGSPSKDSPGKGSPGNGSPGTNDPGNGSPRTQVSQNAPPGNNYPGNLTPDKVSPRTEVPPNAPPGNNYPDTRAPSNDPPSNYRPPTVESAPSTPYQQSANPNANPIDDFADKNFNNQISQLEGQKSPDFVKAKALFEQLSKTPEGQQQIQAFLRKGTGNFGGRPVPKIIVTPPRDN